MNIYVLSICSVLLAVKSLASDAYHNIKYKGPGRAVFLCEGYINPDHPELSGFIKTIADIESSSEFSDESSSEGFDQDTIKSSIDELERMIQQTQHKIAVELKAKKPDNVKIADLEVMLGDQTDDLDYWQSLLRQTPENRQKSLKMTDPAFRHDTECAVRLAGLTLGSARKTPIIGVKNLYEIAAHDLAHFPIVCVNKYLCSLHDDKVVERLYVKIGNSKHLISQVNAAQYLELAKQGALIIEAMFNGEENKKIQQRYAYDLGILAHYINTKTPGAMIIVGATSLKATGEEIASLFFAPHEPGYSSLIFGLGDTSSSWQWDVETNELIESFPPCGSSLAAPIVSAAASQISEQFPQLNAKQARVAILSSGRKVDSISKMKLSDTFANGVLDADAAIIKGSRM